jgi:spermidine synthase
MVLQAVRDRRHFVGIFIVAMAVLAYQVLLTRVFSVMLYYHFAFAAVSLVMLGLTIGAERVYLNAKRYSSANLDDQFAKAAFWFATTSLLAVLWFIYSPLLVPAGAAVTVLAASLILFVVPLVYSGICVTLILTRAADSVGKLYAADLIGAAVGCVGIVAILFWLDPISIFLAIAALVALAGWIVAPAGAASRLRTKLLTLALCVGCLGQSALYLSGSDHLRIVWAKGHSQDGIMFERWNAFSRIRVVPYGLIFPDAPKSAFGWGFGHPQTEPIDQYFIDIDALAGTVLTKFDGSNLKPFAFLGNDVINMGYHVNAPKSVAVVGIGGGRDIMSALYFGVSHVTGIEINPVMFEVLTKKFADFTGNIYKRPDVSLVNAEARSWLNHSGRSFDLIQISLIDTWAATAAGGLTMSENKLYTVDAWKEFLAHLQPGGILAVSRWFVANGHKSEFYKLLSLAAETLRARGVATKDIQSHIMAFSASGIITVLTSPDPCTAAEVAKAHEAAAHEGFTVMVDPMTTWDKMSGIIASGQATSAFYDGLASDISAPTDNRPFFFYTWKPFGFLSGKGYVETVNGIKNDVAVLIIGALLAITLLCVGFFILRPLRQTARQADIRAMAPFLGYFGGIGVGFMLIEISQMQRLMVFLGDPVYGLTVVLFSLLLFGGAGSFAVGRTDHPAILWLRPAICCLVLCSVGLATPGLTDALRTSGVAVRIFASVALLAPAGFCMGMMFPSGMMMSQRFAQQQAWFWGVNGAASVFASVLGMAISMEFGIAQAYWAGVVCYAMCVLLTVQQTRSIVAPVAGASEVTA